MNELIKNLGVIVLIIGAAVLAVPFFTGGMTNSILLTGLGLVLLGYFGHIVINKRHLDLKGNEKGCASLFRTSFF